MAAVKIAGLTVALVIATLLAGLAFALCYHGLYTFAGGEYYAGRMQFLGGLAVAAIAWLIHLAGVRA